MPCSNASEVRSLHVPYLFFWVYMLSWSIRRAASGQRRASFFLLPLLPPLLMPLPRSSESLNTFVHSAIDPSQHLFNHTAQSLPFVPLAFFGVSSPFLPSARARTEREQTSLSHDKRVLSIGRAHLIDLQKGARALQEARRRRACATAAKQTPPPLRAFARSPLLFWPNQQHHDDERGGSDSGSRSTYSSGSSNSSA
jgi:hypothetical protein